MTEKNQDPRPIKPLLVLEVICFVVWLTGVFFFYLPLPESTVALSRAAGEENPADLLSIMLSIIFALILFYWLRRKRAMAPVVAILFGVVIYSTAVIFVAPIVAFLLSVLLVYLERAYRSFATNNLLVLVGVFAAAISFATTFSLNFLLILLGLLSLYDIVGVFFIKAIPRVAKNAAKIGIPLLLAVPKKAEKIFSVPTPDTTASLLGAGDLFIPLLFLMSVSIRAGWEIALVSFAGVVIGSLGNIALVRKIKSGIPAVPLLAIGLATGFGIGLLIFG